jgi:predicted PurR-regulated permease PerM
VLFVFIGIQQLEGHILIPLVMSSRLQLHPVSVIFAVLVMGALFGLVGIFLATPVAAIIKVIFYKFYVEPRSVPATDEIPKAAEQIVSGSNHEVNKSEHEKPPES